MSYQQLLCEIEYDCLIWYLKQHYRLAKYTFKEEDILIIKNQVL